MTLKQKIEEAIRRTLPKGATCTVSITRSGVQDTVVVRVITSAWKSLPRFVRTLRIQKALQSALTAREQEKVLRVSVFGPEELRRTLFYRSSASGGDRAKRNLLTAKIAAKLKKNSPPSTRSNELLLRALEKLRNAKA
jgi:hypothetical protein